MPRVARDVMTPKPACCTVAMPLDQVAKMMVQNDCGEIPVVDENDRVIGVVTDRDIVCRIVAKSQNPSQQTVESCMTRPAVTVQEDAPIEQVVSIMEKHQIRRVPVTNDGGRCSGIISQADLARMATEREVAELVSEVSKG